MNEDDIIDKWLEFLYFKTKFSKENDFEYLLLEFNNKYNVLENKDYIYDTKILEQYNDNTNICENHYTITNTIDDTISENSYKTAICTEKQVICKIKKQSELKENSIKRIIDNTKKDEEWKQIWKKIYILEIYDERGRILNENDIIKCIEKVYKTKRQYKYKCKILDEIHSKYHCVDTFYIKKYLIMKKDVKYPIGIIDSKKDKYYLFENIKINIQIN